MKTVSFGVLVKGDVKKDLHAFLVPIDGAGQSHIESMFVKTQAIVKDANVEDFELAESYNDERCARLNLADELASQIKNLYDAGNIEVKPDVLNELDKVVAYFGMVDEPDRPRKLGMRQARTFKNLRTKPIWSFADGQLTEDTRPKFTLSDSWELTSEGQDLMIVSATAFERICDLTPAIRKAALASLYEIASDLQFLTIEPLKSRVEEFTKSARIVADLRKRGDLKFITVETLRQESDKQGIQYEMIDNNYSVNVGSEEGLLMLLDRRRYADPLVTEKPDIYEADSRKKVARGSGE
jgi:hypothetical protein